MNRETRRRSEVTLINTREPIEVSQRSVEGWGERPHPAVGLVKSTEQPCKGRRVNGPTENMEVRRRVEEGPMEPFLSPSGNDRGNHGSSGIVR